MDGYETLRVIYLPKFQWEPLQNGKTYAVNVKT